MKSDTIGRPMEILLVEDSLSSARLTIAALKKSQVEHRLTWLSNGDEAAEFITRKGKYKQAPKPDLILLDLGLPGLGGEEILGLVRGADELRGVPVVVLTGSDQKIRPCNMDVEGYLTKPIDIEQFLKLVAELKRFWKNDMILPATA